MLRTYLAFVKQSELLVTEENFVYILKNVFLAQPQFGKYRRDVVFDTSGSMLDASRVPVQLRHVGCQNQSRAMQLFRKLAETSKLPTGVYSDFFQFAEQYNAVLPGTLSSIAYASVAVVVVSLLLIPEPVASLWVSFSILSTNTGILGFMSLWSVRLDFISMVTIVMSIGFCVDFAAHLAYNFAKGRNLPVAERMRNALYAVGAPILQSSTSTMLGVSFLASTESYVFRSFLKTIFLVITLGVLHGLVVLPVLLTMFHCSCGTNDAMQHRNGQVQPLFFSTQPSIHFTVTPDVYKSLPLYYQLAYFGRFKNLQNPTEYHESVTDHYSMRARLKYLKSKTMHIDSDAMYFYRNPTVSPQ